MTAEVDFTRISKISELIERKATEIMSKVGLNLLPEGNRFTSEVLYCKSRSKMVKYLCSLNLGNDDELRISLINSLNNTNVTIDDKVLIIDNFTSSTFKESRYPVLREGQHTGFIILNDGNHEISISKSEVITESEYLKIKKISDILDRKSEFRKTNKPKIEILVEEKRRFSIKRVLSVFLGEKILHRGLSTLQRLFLSELEIAKAKLPEALFLNELVENIEGRLSLDKIRNRDKVYCVEIDMSYKTTALLGEVTINKDRLGKIVSFDHADKNTLYDPSIHVFYSFEEVKRMEVRAFKLKNRIYKELLLSLKIKLNGI